MIDLDSIAGFFPAPLRGPAFRKHILKEYVECLALEWIARSPWASRLAFIGGTNLRLVSGIDRFSEDLDFDCKDFPPEDFAAFTDALVRHLVRNGLPATAKAAESARLSAYRRSILFPGFLKDCGLSAFSEERFMMKIEAQDQGVPYPRATAAVNHCGFFFPVPVPPAPVLCAMKLSALLSRAKGRDFYDAVFLLQRTAPDCAFLARKHPGLDTLPAVLGALARKAAATDLSLKRRDVEHLLFRRETASRVTDFPLFLRTLSPENLSRKASPFPAGEDADKVERP